MHVSDEFADVIKRHKPQSLSLAAFCAYLIEQALDTGFTLGKPSAAKAAEPERGEGFTSSSKAVNKRKTLNSYLKSLPPSLHAHEDLITAFWKTKAGAKSEAGWKLLMTELGKIQEKYGDRVVRDQLELAAANRWKGVSLKNYEQFGLNKPPARDADIDFEALDKIKMPW